MAKEPLDKASDPVSRLAIVDATSSAKELTHTLDAAIEEAERDGYVSADEGRRQVKELLRNLRARAATGQIKP
jgi:hypothetical protein